ncbi:MAG: sialidase family protein [Vicinamibacterales bacterium]
MKLLSCVAAVGFVALAATTLHPHAVTRTTLAVPGRANANVSMAVSGSFVAAVWSASAPAGDTDVFAATSRDGGQTFSAPVRVNSTPGDARVNGEQPPRLALKARAGSVPEVVVVWTTKGSAGTKLLQSTSTDGGRTFAASTLVPGSDAAGNRGWEAVAAGPRRTFLQRVARPTGNCRT